MRLLGLLLLLFALAVESTAAADWVVAPVPSLRDDELVAHLYRLVAAEPAIYGIAVKHLLTGQQAAINGDRVFEAASLYKLAVMVELYAQHASGEVDLDAEFPAYTVVGYDRGGFPIFGEPTTYSLREALVTMIAVSDNEAAQFLLYRLGPERVNRRMAALGLPNTRVDWDTTTTPNETLTLLELMATGQLVSRAASAEMIEVLLDQRVNDRIPVGLPAGVPVAHKTGNLPGLAHDAGIVYAANGPYILVVLTDELWEIERGYTVIHEVTRFVHRYFERRLPLVQVNP